jgi:hypothetical protein
VYHLFAFTNLTQYQYFLFGGVIEIILNFYFLLIGTLACWQAGYGEQKEKRNQKYRLLKKSHGT